MYDGGFGEHFGYSVFWSACNDQFEHLQVVSLNPTFEHAQEALVIVHRRRVMPKATTLAQCIYHDHCKLPTQNIIQAG